MICRTRTVNLLAAVAAVALGEFRGPGPLCPHRQSVLRTSEPRFHTWVLLAWSDRRLASRRQRRGQCPGPPRRSVQRRIGSQIAYTGPGNGSVIIQDVGPVIPGGIYTLSVEVGQRLDFPLLDYNLMLGFGGHDLVTTTRFATASQPAGIPSRRVPMFSRR